MPIDEFLINEARDAWWKDRPEDRFNKDGFEYGVCVECKKRSDDIGDIELIVDGKSGGYVCEDCHKAAGGE